MASLSDHNVEKCTNSAVKLVQETNLTAKEIQEFHDISSLPPIIPIRLQYFYYITQTESRFLYIYYRMLLPFERILYKICGLFTVRQLVEAQLDSLELNIKYINDKIKEYATSLSSNKEEIEIPPEVQSTFDSALKKAYDDYNNYVKRYLHFLRYVDKKIFHEEFKLTPEDYVEVFRLTTFPVMPEKFDIEEELNMIRLWANYACEMIDNRPEHISAMYSLLLTALSSCKQDYIMSDILPLHTMYEIDRVMFDICHNSCLLSIASTTFVDVCDKYEVMGLTNLTQIRSKVYGNGLYSPFELDGYYADKKVIRYAHTTILRSFNFGHLLRPCHITYNLLRNHLYPTLIDELKVIKLILEVEESTLQMTDVKVDKHNLIRFIIANAYSKILNASRFLEYTDTWMYIQLLNFIKHKLIFVPKIKDLEIPEFVGIDFEMPKLEYINMLIRDRADLNYHYVESEGLYRKMCVDNLMANMNLIEKYVNKCYYACLCLRPKAVIGDRKKITNDQGETIDGPHIIKGCELKPFNSLDQQFREYWSLAGTMSI